MAKAKIAFRCATTQERLKQLFTFEPATGKFMRLLSRGNRAAGTVPGWINPDGYHMICVDGISYLAHRLAILYVTGSWPDDVVDHANLRKSDNGFDNLRPTTYSGNAQNRPVNCNNKVGMTGVSWNMNTGKWRATITVNRKQHHLGLHLTAEDAYAAYLVAKARLHTFQPTVPVPA